MRINMSIGCKTVIGLLFLTTSAFAQQPTFHDVLLDHFVGNWVLRGTIAHKAATHDVTAEWVLEHQYLKFHEVSREKNPDGTPFYEANVYIGWDEKASEYRCVWLDTYGDIAPISLGWAPRNGNEIAFLFKDTDSTFHTTLLYKPETR